MQENVLLFLISYISLFILYIIFYYMIGLKRKTILKSLQVEFLKIRFGFKEKELNPKKIGLIVCFLDPFIISVVGVIVTLPKWNYVFQLLLGFVLLMGLIYSCYEILGRILVKRKKEK